MVTNKIIWNFIKKGSFYLYLASVLPHWWPASRPEGVCYKTGYYLVSSVSQFLLTHIGSPHWMWTKYLSVCCSLREVARAHLIGSFWKIFGSVGVGSTHKRLKKNSLNTYKKNYYYFPNCFGTPDMCGKVNNNFFFWGSVMLGSRNKNNNFRIQD